MRPELDEARIDELRDFVAGRLGTDRRSEIERAIASDPALAQIVATVALERDAAANWAERQVPEGEFDALYARIEPRLIGMRQSVTPARSTSPWRWLDWLAAPQWRPALAGLLLLVTGQSLVIGWLTQSRVEAPGEEATRSAAKAPHEFLGVTFTPEATEEQIRALLLENQAQILAGPRPSGEYVIAAPGRADGALADHLRKQSIVLDARRLAGPPTQGVPR